MGKENWNLIYIYTIHTVVLHPVVEGITEGFPWTQHNDGFMDKK